MRLVVNDTPACTTAAPLTLPNRKDLKGTAAAPIILRQESEQVPWPVVPSNLEGSNAQMTATRQTLLFHKELFRNKIDSSNSCHRMYLRLLCLSYEYIVM